MPIAFQMNGHTLGFIFDTFKVAVTFHSVQGH